jgi:hypothetical protein
MKHFLAATIVLILCNIPVALKAQESPCIGKPGQAPPACSHDDYCMIYPSEDVCQPGYVNPYPAPSAPIYYLYLPTISS